MSANSYASVSLCSVQEATCRQLAESGFTFCIFPFFIWCRPHSSYPDHSWSAPLSCSCPDPIAQLVVENSFRWCLLAGSFFLRSTAIDAFWPRRGKKAAPLSKLPGADAHLFYVVHRTCPLACPSRPGSWFVSWAALSAFLLKLPRPRSPHLVFPPFSPPPLFPFPFSSF